MEIYQTNKSEDIINDETLNRAINLIDNYFDNLTQEKFLQDYDSIISTLLTITSEEFEQVKVNTILNILTVIIVNIDPLINEMSKVQVLYSILDNLNKKAGSYLECIFNIIFKLKISDYKN